MAAERPTVGLDHPTVVPANFDPDGSGAAGEDGDGSDEDTEATDADGADEPDGVRA